MAEEQEASAASLGEPTAEGPYMAAGPEATEPPPGSQDVGGAPVEEGEEAAVQGSSEPPPVPANFVLAALGDEERAKQNWLETLRWRRENQIEKVIRVRRLDRQLTSLTVSDGGGGGDRQAGCPPCLPPSLPDWLSVPWCSRPRSPTSS